MPKILGLNIVAVLVASVVFFLVGWLWYGVVFMDAWMEGMGIPQSADQEMDPMIMVIGFIITVMQVIGIGLVLKWKGAAGLNGAVVTAVTLWFFFAVPFSAYGYLYAMTPSMPVLLIDASHLLVGWVVSAIILSMMK